MENVFLEWRRPSPAYPEAVGFRREANTLRRPGRLKVDCSGVYHSGADAGGLALSSSETHESSHWAAACGRRKLARATVDSKFAKADEN